MAFNSDTGVWTEDKPPFDQGATKQAPSTGGVPALDTPNQVPPDPSAGVATPLPPAPTDTLPPAPAPTTPKPPAQDAGPTVPSDIPQGAAGHTSAVTGGATAAGAPTIDSLTRDALMKLLQTPQGVDAQSLMASPEAAAERLQSQRSAEREMAQVAEQGAQSGIGHTGGEQGILRGVTETQGARDTTFLGQLAEKTREQQIQQLQAGLQMALAKGDSESARALQLQLAQMQSATAANSLGYNYAALQEQANRDAVLAILGR
jgi:hypothetical protein